MKRETSMWSHIGIKWLPLLILVSREVLLVCATSALQSGFKKGNGILYCYTKFFYFLRTFFISFNYFDF